MQTFALTSLLAASAAAAMTGQFSLPTLTTHEPNGNPEGQVNYYRIAFDVNSTNPLCDESAYCNVFWGDNGVNGFTTEVAYSKYVPLDWKRCDTSEGTFDRASNFEFRLFPYFSIGNYTLEVRHNITIPNTDNTVTFDGMRHFSNETDPITCEINPQQVQYQVHAHGDCNITPGKGPLTIESSEVEA